LKKNLFKVDLDLKNWEVSLISLHKFSTHLVLSLYCVAKFF